MTINRDGQRPDSYQGLNPVQNPPIIKATRVPGTLDRRYKVGTVWINTSTNQAWFLTSVSAGSATWALASPGASDVDTLTGDSGGALSPVGGNITLAGGTNITTAGAGSTITFNLDAAITLATSVTSALYTTAAGTDLLITSVAGQNVVIKMGDAAGANKVSFTDSADVEVAAIDSNGGFTMGALTFTGLLTANASATINTAGTALNLGTDNSGDAVNIALGTAARAVSIATSAAAHTVAIGNASAGAITVDTAAGISLDSATASNFTVTGASADLTLSSSGGSVNITASEAAADAIVMNASDAAGGINITAGTNNVSITGCDLVLASVATKIQMNGGAATDFIGQATLVNGVVTVANTNIAAGDRILITRSATNASTALGVPVTSISAGASFTIRTRQAATPGSDETGDQSTFDYVIVRQF